MALFIALPILPANLSADEAVRPVLSRAHREFLSRVVRRTLRNAVLGRDMYEPEYVPSELTRTQAEVMVRLRQRGFPRAEVVVGPLPVAVAARDAAVKAAQVLAVDAGVDLDVVNQLLVEIEVFDPAEPFTVEGDWTRPGVLDPHFEPGLHGLNIRGPRGHYRFCPSDLVTNDMVLADVLKKVAEFTHGDPSQLHNVQLLRFRSTHWYEPNALGEIVELHRGLLIVPPERVRPAELDRAIAALADYMAYRQRGDGSFAYQYEPARDIYSDENNPVRQAGAALAVVIHAARSGSSASKGAAEMALRYHLDRLVDIPDLPGASYIATPDRRNKLGVTALICAALAEHPDAARFAETRKKLVNGMLWLQRPSGMFVTAFPPAEEIEGQDYFPGEALLAMADHYALEPTAEILDAFDRAIAYYRSWFRDARSPAFVPWQVQAFAAMAGQTKRRDYIDFVFELTDWLAEMQLNPSNCPYPELHGGIASYQPGRAGIATASYLEAFADALAVARMAGDAARVKRYESLVRDAARFVLQLQVRPEEAWFIRSPKDAVGGMRTSPTLNLLRIDHCQHAMIALIKTRRALFDDRG